MSIFKVGDVVRRIKDPAGDLPVGTICTVEKIKNNAIYVNAVEGGYSECFFEFVSRPAPVVPHVHCDLIKQWADGAVIEYMDYDRFWSLARTPRWALHVEYRVKPAEPVEPPPSQKDYDEALAIIEKMQKLCRNFKGNN